MGAFCFLRKLLPPAFCGRNDSQKLLSPQRKKGFVHVFSLSYFVSLSSFCRLSIRRENVHALWRKWRQSGGWFYHIPVLYTLFFFSLVADDYDNEVGEKKNPTKKKGKLFVIQHYKDGRALFPLTFEEELGRGKVIFIFHSSRSFSFGTLCASWNSVSTDHFFM